jgi:hypothetical protein
LFFSAAQLAGRDSSAPGLPRSVNLVGVRKDNSPSYTLTQLLSSLPAPAPARLLFSFKLWPAGAYFASKTESIGSQHHEGSFCVDFAPRAAVSDHRWNRAIQGRVRHPYVDVDLDPVVFDASGSPQLLTSTGEFGSCLRVATATRAANGWYQNRHQLRQDSSPLRFLIGSGR